MKPTRHTDNLRQLDHLIALQECGDFGRAAERLDITKSALSQSLQRLEDIYGVALFVRGRRKLSATVYGEILVETARKIRRQFEQARREFDLLQNMETGRLVIGCDPLLADGVLAPTLSKIVADYPKLQFTQKSGSWQMIMEQLRQGDVDIFLGLLPDQPMDGFHFEELELPPLTAFARAGHPILQRLAITIEDCREYPIIAAPVPDWYLQRLARGDRTGRLSVNRLKEAFLTSDSQSLIRDIVCESESISADFGSSLKPYFASGLLAPLNLREEGFVLPLPAVLITPLDRALPPSSVHLAKTVKIVVEQLKQN